MADGVPFNQAKLAGRELEYIQEAVHRGHLSGDGVFTRRCQGILEGLLPGSRALLTTSCTHALEMSALLLDLQAGDEVILPSFTFVSTVNAYVLRGVKPVFCDVRRDTLNLDEAKLEALITDRTKAIVAVHYAGVGCEMDAINELARPRSIAVVEDNAHGLFGTYRGRPLGTLGTMSTLSFHETKNLTCGEGGALILNDPSFMERSEILREKGTDRSKFFRGEVDKYTWVDLGSSYVPSELLAAFLCAQLEEHASIQSRRAELWTNYQRLLADLGEAGKLELPQVPEHCGSPHHLFHILLPTPELRRGLAEYLKQRQISAIHHYLPLHTSLMGRRYGGKEGDCPVTEDISARLLRLPLFLELTSEQQELVAREIGSFLG